MAKHHVNPNTGNPGICKSAKGKCPFGSEDEHFRTAEAATEAAEKLMADQYSAVNNAYRKKDSSALDGMNREMKKRIIAEASSGSKKLHPSVVAKVFSKDNDELIRKNVSETFNSQKVLREMSTDDSARVRLAVAKATNNPAVLKAMAEDPDIKVRKAAIANQKTPVKARKAALATLGVKTKTAESKPTLPKWQDLPKDEQLSSARASLREVTEAEGNTAQAIDIRENERRIIADDVASRDWRDRASGIQPRPDNAARAREARDAVQDAPSEKSLGQQQREAGFSISPGLFRW